MCKMRKDFLFLILFFDFDPEEAIHNAVTWYLKKATSQIAGRGNRVQHKNKNKKQ